MAKKKDKNNKNDFVFVVIKKHNDNKGGHPHVIIRDIEQNHVSVGLSTKPKKGKNSPNYPLEHNPLGGDSKSYMRRQGTVAPKRQYGKAKPGQMTPKDYSKAVEYGDAAEKKYIAKKHKKK